MVTRLLGKKLGMTQLFDESRQVTPVSVIDINGWFITQIKTQEKDGYSALQLGLLKKKFQGKPFLTMWLHKKADFFSNLREVAIEQSQETAFTVEQKLTFDLIGLQENDSVDATGTSKGAGFQGVVKRWDFRGGPKSHGSTFHRTSGSVGNLRRGGRILRGQKMAGHMGCEKITTKGLKIVKIDKENGCLFVKGSIPGKKNSLILLRKQG